MMFRASPKLMAFDRCWRGPYTNTMLLVTMASHSFSLEEYSTVSLANKPDITTKILYGDALDALFQTPSL